MDAVLSEADAHGVMVVSALVALTTLVLSRVLVHLGRIDAGGRSPLPPQRDRTARIDSPAAPPYRSPTLSTSTEESAARRCQAPPAWSVCLAFMLAVGALHLVARTSLTTLRATGRCDDLTLAPWSAWDDADAARAALAMSVLWLRSEARTRVERGERARSIDSLDDAGAERAFRTLIPTRGCTAAAEGALRAGRLRVARTIARSCHTDPATQLAWAANYALAEWPYHPDDAPLAARRLREGESAGLEHVVFGDRRDFGSRDDLRDLIGRDFCFAVVMVPTVACDQSSGRLRCEREDLIDVVRGATSPWATSLSPAESLGGRCPLRTPEVPFPIPAGVSTSRPCLAAA